jgi:L-amino acid N-acyltransferase YncA
MTELSIEFRQADDSDWAAIWPIVKSTLSAADTYPYSPETTEAEGRLIWLDSNAPSRLAYVAKSGEEVVATAYLKPNLPGLGDHIANAGWMVKKSFRGRGLGRAFATYVVEEARRLGYRGMQFNAVVATNEAAIALWKSMGFELIGTVPRAFRHFDEGLVPILVMYRDL